MDVDSQITEALREAEIAIMKQDRLRELRAREQHIRASRGEGWAYVTGDEVKIIVIERTACWCNKRKERIRSYAYRDRLNPR